MENKKWKTLEKMLNHMLKMYEESPYKNERAEGNKNTIKIILKMMEDLEEEEKNEKEEEP